jgi:hypothetical protein
MRLLLIPVLCGAMAGSLYAQGMRGRGYAGPSIRVPVRSSTFGAPQLPPGTALNGVPGLQNSVTFNGLPAFSNGIYQFGCYNCRPQTRGRSRAAGLGFVPLFNGYAFPGTFSEEDAGPPPPPMPDPAALALSDEVNKLRGDINQLKEQTQALTAPPPPAPAAAPAPSEPPAPATVLVLRDGKQVETTNYAVMDQTLWNFSARPVQKIPLASIDLPASQKANSARGVDFSLSDDSNN